MIEDLDQVASVIAGAKRLVAFTGAGISAESEIPTFRDPGGLWDRYDPEIISGASDYMTGSIPKIVRDFLGEILATIESASPNPAHLALAELERMGMLHAVITQNIDNLHYEAGNTTVIEVHGNFYRLRCLSCGAKSKLTKGNELSYMMRQLVEMEAEDKVEVARLMPGCRQCGGLTRFDVVNFGEPVQAFDQAESAARSCDVMLALGTSGVITPAAFLPGYAKGSGATVIEINATGRYFPDVSDYSIVARAGEIMPQVVAAVRDKLV